MTTTETTDLMGQALRSAREARGWSLDEATFQARIQFPALRIGRGKIHRLERGVADRDRLDINTVMALASLYDLRVTELDPAFADEVREIKELAGQHSPCNPDPFDNGTHRHLQAA